MATTPASPSRCSCRTANSAALPTRRSTRRTAPAPARVRAPFSVPPRWLATIFVPEQLQLQTSCNLESAGALCRHSRRHHGIPVGPEEICRCAHACAGLRRAGALVPVRSRRAGGRSRGSQPRLTGTRRRTIPAVARLLARLPGRRVPRPAMATLEARHAVSPIAMYCTERLGDGGHAEVWAAQRRADRPRAGAEVPASAHAARADEALPVLQHEARMAQRLEHPGVLRVEAPHARRRHRVPAHGVRRGRRALRACAARHGGASCRCCCEVARVLRTCARPRRGASGHQARQCAVRCLWPGARGGLRHRCPHRLHRCDAPQTARRFPPARSSCAASPPARRTMSMDWARSRYELLTRYPPFYPEFDATARAGCRIRRARCRCSPHPRGCSISCRPCWRAIRAAADDRCGDCRVSSAAWQCHYLRDEEATLIQAAPYAGRPSRVPGAACRCGGGWRWLPQRAPVAAGADAGSAASRSVAGGRNAGTGNHQRCRCGGRGSRCLKRPPAVPEPATTHCR